jgi:hypothetical protein
MANDNIVPLHRGYVRPLPNNVLILGEAEHYQPYEACDEDSELRYLSLTAALTIAFLAGMAISSLLLIIGAALLGALN